jgi:hypothetical protein
MLHLLQEAVNLPLGLRKCTGQWDAISLDLRETPRERVLQTAKVEQRIAAILS